MANSDCAGNLQSSAQPGDTKVFPKKDNQSQTPVSVLTDPAAVKCWMWLSLA